MNVTLRSPGAPVATWFGVGLIRPAPGTWGSLAALPLGVAALYAAGPWGPAVAAAVVCGLGFPEIRRLLASLPEDSERDRGEIVVDEVAGQLVALIPAGLSPALWIAAFALFRLFDIWKPWPIRRIERAAPGAFGILLDDIAAGAMAAAAVAVLGLAGLGDVR